MIKLIVFDLVGVLVSEKNVKLSQSEEKLEKLFGPNISDAQYLKEAKKIIEADITLIKTIEKLINKIYEVNDKNLFKLIKDKDDNIKIIIATNHVSYIRSYINQNFDVGLMDDLIISAEIGKIKPNKDFYEYIINKLNVKAGEILFLDDNKQNIITANKLGMHTILVYGNMKLFDEIIKYI